MIVTKSLTRASRFACGLVLAWSCSACTAAPPMPVAVDTRHDACSNCRMTVSDRKVAAELVAPGEEPRFFDDLGCLREYLRTHGPVDAHARLFLTDFATGTFVDAREAVIVASTYRTPMGSHLVSFANAAAARQAGHADGDIEPAADVLGTPMPGDTR